VKYTVIVKQRAEKELLEYPRQDYERIKLRIRSLEKNPRPPGAIRLKTKHNYRMRVGNFRVIYNIDDADKLVEIGDSPSPE
jgi:mRNA interferase RelE/StbE